MTSQNYKLIGLGFALCAMLTPRVPVHAAANETPNLATPENLESFELQADYTAADLYDAAQAEHAESSGEFAGLHADLQVAGLRSPVLGFATTLAGGKSPNVTVEIFQNARTVGPQFLVARQGGSIRYVFAVSAAGHGKSTPGGTFGVDSQAWRHMSSKYPGSGENNMDHATFFAPAIGFHSTTFGLYTKLGHADSHGCVRMGRPEARKIYMLIANNGGAATVVSRPSGEPSAQDLDLVKKQLAKDFNFLQYLLKTHNKGDVPFTEAEYRSYLSGALPDAVVKAKMKAKGISQIVEIPRDQDLGPR